MAIEIEVSDAAEQAGYLEISGAHLYTVLHKVPDPVGRALLAGPFGSERLASYIPWVRWARFLAAQGIETLRYDYRGMGESTGAFENMSFEDWMDDVRFLAGWLKGRGPDVPLILHGLELGALLAGNVFASGTADALLLWAAPADANEVLRASLLRQVATENMFRRGEERKPLAHYVRQLQNEPLSVDGYQWSSRLWRESFDFKTPFVQCGDAESQAAGARPLRISPLDKTSAPLVKGSRYELMNPDLSGLFAENFAWIAGLLPTGR